MNFWRENKCAVILWGAPLLFLLGFATLQMWPAIVKMFSQSSPSDWLQVIASIATALTAFFSWRAIQQAEEMNIKPILGVSDPHYADKKFSLTVSNFSKTGDKWARDIRVSIAGLEQELTLPNLLGPGDEHFFVFDEISEDNWREKILTISYRASNNKKFSIRYKISGKLGLKSPIHSRPTEVQIERI